MSFLPDTLGFSGRGGNMEQIIDQALGVKIGAPATFKNMTVFPLLGGQGTAADYLTLDEALAAKAADTAPCFRRPSACAQGYRLYSA